MHEYTHRRGEAGARAVIVVEIVLIHGDHRKLEREPDVADEVDRRHPAAADLMQDLISPGERAIQLRGGGRGHERQASVRRGRRGTRL